MSDEVTPSFLIPQIITDFFNLIVLVFNAIVDGIYGMTTIAYKVAQESVLLIPMLFDIIDIILDFVDYSVELFEGYWQIPAILFTLIPMYFMMFFLIGRINSLFP